MWKIGNVEIDNQVVLAPMAGISNSAYRRICKEMGCGLIYAEMVSDKAISFGNKKTLDMLYMTDNERPIAQQIFGTDVESFVVAAKYIEKTMKPDIIDINMGCPVPKVALRAQAGSALLKNPQKIREIVSAVVAAVNVPVTVKIRSGWDSEHINAVEVAKICEEAGASAITVHPRTRKQGYSGKADWLIIKNVKDNVSIPVIGNGDIKTPEDAKRMLNETGCDAIMIGRGLLGNPWLIRNTLNYLAGRDYELPSTEEKIKMCIKHLKYLSETKDEKIAVLEIRSHAAWYLKGIENASLIKNKIYQCNSIRDIMQVLNEFLGGKSNE
jgi:putative TIM-barrel protein, nifR3 family